MLDSLAATTGRRHPLDLKADKTNLNSLLTVPGQQFRVPEYQRPYAWADPQIDELWDDLMASMGDTHFMGSVVLNVENPDAPQIIDGQQRLTTLTILLALIRDRYHVMQSQYVGHPDPLILNSYEPGDKAFKLRSGDANWQVLRDFVLRKPTDEQRRELGAFNKLERNVRIRNKRLTTNLKRLDDHLDAYLKHEPDTEAALYRLEQQIRTRLEFVTISVGNVGDAFLLFETLNDRGLQLSAADLLKSHLLSRVAQQHHDDEVVHDASVQWDDLIDRLAGQDVTRFLRHFLLISRSKVRKDEVFSLFKDDVTAYGPNKLLDRLTEYAGYYGQLFEPATIEHAQTRRAIADLKGLNVVSHYVLLMAALKHLSSEDLVRLARVAEMLSFRWVVCGRNAQELETKYAKAAEMLDKSDGSQVIEVESTLLDSLPGSDEFIERFISMRMGVKYVTRYVLRRIEETVHPTGEIDLKGSAEVHIEHIMPRTATDYWVGKANGDLDGYDDAVDRWGNLTLLHGRPNQTISNGDFEVKRQHFAKSDIATTRMLAELRDWDTDQIERRQFWLAQVADVTWSPAAIEGAELSPPAWPPEGAVPSLE